MKNPGKNKMIEYENLAKSNQLFFKEYEKKFSEILKSGRYVSGENVQEFEKEFADYNKAKFCISVGSGLDALRLSLLSLDLPKGSEIIVASNTYIATILPIIEFGFKPILVEPDIKTYNIDPIKIKEKITNKTSAIMITHLYGLSCDMDSIMEIVNTYKLKLIEDCAQAHGAEYDGKKVGTFGDCGCFSFYPTKNLGGIGEGGVVITQDEKIAEKIRGLRNYGSNKKYYNEIIGYNSRMDEIQAGFLRIKLKKLDEINSKKVRLAKLYDKLIINPGIIKPVLKENGEHIYHIYNIRTNKRDKLKEYLEENGILTAIHYPVPPHHQEAIKGIVDKEFPISKKIHDTTLSLPISYFHTEEDAKVVTKVINNFAIHNI